MDTDRLILLVVTPSVAMLVPMGFAIGFCVVGATLVSSICDGISKIWSRRQRVTPDTARTEQSEKDTTPPICTRCAFHVPSASGGTEPYCTNEFVNSAREISVVTGERTGHAPTCEDARRYGGMCGPNGKWFKGWDPRQKPHNGRG